MSWRRSWLQTWQPRRCWVVVAVVVLFDVVVAVRMSVDCVWASGVEGTRAGPTIARRYVLLSYTPSSF